ncbi:hypothetical protein [Halorhabdus sp. BNX81]|uniref:hypothetical protein n=1 Tax=Halorhabdus sp. BNX81 TaxID=2980181 RepID=UPI0023DD5757|nr:hypothetical protein [Halorhabdus sp. BNX81]WEL22320.1 hypothetical protein HBNXHr_2274 [Halorhabdus sp. BNX81]
MGSSSRLGLLLGLGLLLSGGLAYGVGMYQESSACTSGHMIMIEQMSADESVHPPIEEVAFENLSSAEQDLFRETLAGNTTKFCNDTELVDTLSGKVILYQGDRYSSSLLAFDGTSWGFPLVLVGMAAVLLGGALSVLTGGIVVLRRIWDRLLIE